MTLRAPVGPPGNKPWRRTPAEVKTDAAFISRVLELWDQRKDTKDIARETFEEESVVAKALRIGREKRRQEEWR